MVHGAIAIAIKDLRRRIRDRSAILVTVILPFALAGIFSLTLGGVDDGTLEAEFAIVRHDGGPVVEGFVRIVHGLDLGTLRDASDRDQAERLADDGEIDAAFVFSEGFSASVESGGGGELDVIASPESDVGTLVAVALARSYASRLDAVNVALATAGPPPADPIAASEFAARAQRVRPHAEIVDAAVADRVFSQATYFAVGMAVFFLFFAVEFGVRGLLEEREDGTLARLLVAPIRPAAILLGKAFASLVVGLISTTLLVFASSWLLDAHWGDPVGVALLVLTGVIVAVAATALASTLAGSSSQASSFVSILAVVGGLLGGTFFPISQAPGLFAQLRFLSPQGWLMDGFQELAAGGKPVDALPAAAGTLAIAAVCGTLAWIRAGRLVRR